uniref:Uncharacterized protein n=1 Tax=Magallana gigas TaxID=29159 RepID=A0A8W8JI11_MAGGI
MSVLLQGVELGVINVPLHRICLKSDLITGPVTVGVRPTPPVPGVSLLLGNDLAGGKVVPDPIVCERVTSNVTSDDGDDDLYPACAVTRAMARRREMEADHSTGPVTKDSLPDIDLNDTFFSNIDDYKTSIEPQDFRKIVKNTPLLRFIGNDKLNLPSKQENDILSREQLLAEQHTDSDVIQLSKRALPPEEVIKVGECFYLNDGILMRKWRPPEASPDEVWRVVYQIVVPAVNRKDIMAIAHETPMADREVAKGKVAD